MSDQWTELVELIQGQHPDLIQGALEDAGIDMFNVPGHIKAALDQAGFTLDDGGEDYADDSEWEAPDDHDTGGYDDFQRYHDPEEEMIEELDAAATETERRLDRPLTSSELDRTGDVVSSALAANPDLVHAFESHSHDLATEAGRSAYARERLRDANHKPLTQEQADVIDTDTPQGRADYVTARLSGELQADDAE